MEENNKEKLETVNENNRAKLEEDTEVYVEVSHKKGLKRKPRHKFSIVISGLLLSASLVTLIGCNFKSTGDVSDMNIDMNDDMISDIKEESGGSFDEGVFLQNIKLIKDTLEEAHKEGKWYAKASVFNELNTLLVRLNSTVITDDNYKVSQDVLDMVKEVDVLLGTLNNDEALKSESGVVTNHKNSVDIMNKLKETLSLNDSATDVKEDTGGSTTVGTTTGSKIPVETEGDRAGSSTKIYLGSEKPYETGGQKGQVKTRYGNHNYGCKTQAEYDEVMRIVDDFVANLSEDDITSHHDWEMYQLWLREQSMEDISADLQGTENIYSNANGAYVEIERSGLYDSFLSGIRNLKAGLKGAINQEEFETAVKLKIVINKFSTQFMNNTTDPKDGSPSSAYDTLVKGISDCDADAQTEMALLDRLGFNTALIANYENEHGWCDIKLGKYWWGAGVFAPTAKKISDIDGSKLSVHVQPTYDIPNS